MTEKSKQHGASNDNPADVEPEAAAGGAEQTAAADDALARENAQLKDQLLRLAAEMENLRKRTSRDVHDARTYAVTNFARDMLNVSDNLRRALESIPSDALEAGDDGLKALAEGVDLTERSLLDALDRHGVKRIDPQGQKFDPNFHQAMFEIPDSTVPNNTVMQVVQSGYVIGERVLRPAMVGVSRGGPKQAPAGGETAEPGPVDANAERDA